MPSGGLPWTQGRSSWQIGSADADSIQVERVRAAGAIFIGKANTPEFGLGSQTYNRVFGATRNPCDPTRAAGGSSGGAAAALALRMLPVADGTNHAGSLRNPAALNTVFTLRPSFGRVPTKQEDAFSTSLGVPGPMAGTAEDLVLLLAVQAGPDDRRSLFVNPARSSRMSPVRRSPTFTASTSPGGRPLRVAARTGRHAQRTRLPAFARAYDAASPWSAVRPPMLDEM